LLEKGKLRRKKKKEKALVQDSTSCGRSNESPLLESCRNSFIQKLLLVTRRTKGNEL